MRPMLLAITALCSMGSIVVAAGPTSERGIMSDGGADSSVAPVRKRSRADPSSRPKHRSRHPQAKPKRKPNRVTIGRRVRRKHRRAA